MYWEPCKGLGYPSPLEDIVLAHVEMKERYCTGETKEEVTGVFRYHDV